MKVTELCKKVPNDSARYHLYLFKHTYEGDYMEFIIFIYSMPGYSCSIKERMLYSSCKGSLIETIEILGVKIDKKVIILNFFFLNVGKENSKIKSVFSFVILQWHQIFKREKSFNFLLQ